jgi:hypothetical protein
LASVASGLGLFPALSNVIHNCSTLSSPGSAAGARTLSQDGEIPITRRVLSGLKPTRSVFASPAAELLIGLLAFLPCMVIPPNTDAAAVKAEASKPLKHTVKSDEIPLHCPARFITAIVPGPRGSVWISGEDTGIYHATLTVRSARAPTRSRSEPVGLSHRAAPALNIHAKWTHFDRSNSPGLVSDSITTLCVDGKGRLWAGTDRHGVCVFNGEKWRHYGILTGPLGCHVYAISFDRAANQIWIATENGISIYQCGQATGINPVARVSARRPVPRYASRTWHYMTSLDGLPPNPDAVAFSTDGMAFIGTQCNGLVIAEPVATSHFSSNINNVFPIKSIKYQLHCIAGPWHPPITAYGHGLPSNLINAINVSADGHVEVATDLGLAASVNNGKTFRYERGSDYAAKVLGLWHPPIGFRPPPMPFLNRLLPGDHITCIAQDVAGHLWIGTWRNGYEVLNPKTSQFYKSENDPTLKTADGYISVICPVQIPHSRNQIVLIGRYGFGVSAFGRYVSVRCTGHRGQPMPKPLNSTWRRASPAPAALPVPAPAPSPEALSRLSDEASKLAAAKHHSGFAFALPSDWRTQGNWIDRYGIFADVCATMNGDGCDQGGGYDNALFTYRSWAGPAGDYLRYWVQWDHSSQNRVLQDLNRGGRKESEWDDHGEGYAFTKSGLGVYCTMHLPKGVFEISSYCVNKDGHGGTDRDRDYVASLCQTPMPERVFLALGKNPAAARIVWQTMHQASGIAHSRVNNFWGGVYTRFAIRQTAPGYITLAIHRNFSFNTITCGVFINRVGGKPQDGYTVFFHPISTFTANIQPQTPASQENAQHTQLAVKLLNDILSLRRHHPLIYMRYVSALAIPVLRYFAKRPDSTVLATASVAGLGRALARLARDAGLFRLAERVHQPRQLFEGYCREPRPTPAAFPASKCFLLWVCQSTPVPR